MKVPPVNCKVFERTTVLKNGTPCSLKITSEAPRKFEFDMLELNQKQGFPLQYHLSTKKGDLDSAMSNHSSVMDKLQKNCADNNIVLDAGRFFSKVLFSESY